MRYILLTIFLISLTGCKPPETNCAQFVEVEGMDRRGVDYNMNAACSAIQKKFPLVDLEDQMKRTDVKMTLYRASFFGGGPQVSKNCTHYRSGTCTSFKADGSIEVEIRKDENTADKIIHEMKHVSLRMVYPALPVEDHHKWMIKNNECSRAYDSCGMLYGPDTSFTNY